MGGHVTKMDPATELIVKQVVERERARCVELCRQRAALWRRTELARSDIALARDEARARANEAGYIADLLEMDAPAREEPAN